MRIFYCNIQSLFRGMECLSIAFIKKSIVYLLGRFMSTAIQMKQMEMCARNNETLQDIIGLK